MSSSEPPAPGGAEPEIVPTEVLAVAGRVDTLHHGLNEARDALRGLATTPLPVGSGQDNAAIVAWYRGLVERDAVPAVAAIAADLNAARGALGEVARTWTRDDAAAAAAFRAVEEDRGPR